MARPLRLEYAGGIYHVTSRGNARGDIFLDDRDRENFLAILAKVVAHHNWLCHAYCLMDNHYHLLLETPDPNLSLGMRQLNGIFTQTFNRRHQRVGHLFQGRYKSIMVEKGSHLLELCRYIVLNPVRAGAVPQPGKWPWSSYLATASAGAVPDFLAVDWVLSQFGGTRTTARSRYRQFVAEGMRGRLNPWHGLVGQVFLGNESFVARMRELLDDREEMHEIPRKQRYPADRPFGNSLQGARRQANSTATGRSSRRMSATGIR